jgi:hypothetical protein
VLGDPVVRGAAHTLIVILDGIVGKWVRLAERFAQHQPEHEPES